MSERYGTRARGGTKSILAKRKRNETGVKSGAPKPRQRISMLSNAGLLGLLETGRPRDRSGFRKELLKRGVELPKAA